MSFAYNWHTHRTQSHTKWIKYVLCIIIQYFEVICKSKKVKSGGKKIVLITILTN